MDKTIEVVVVAMVALVTGLALLYLATGQAEGFGGFADTQQQSAQCSYYEERISRTCQDNSDKITSLEQAAPEECTIEATPRNCDDGSDSSGSETEYNSDSGTTGPQE